MIQRIQAQTRNPILHTVEKHGKTTANKVKTQIDKLSDVTLSKSQFNAIRSSAILTTLGGLLCGGGYECTDGYDGPSCANPDFCF